MKRTTIVAVLFGGLMLASCGADPQEYAKSACECFMESHSGTDEAAMMEGSTSSHGAELQGRIEANDCLRKTQKEIGAIAASNKEELMNAIEEQCPDLKSHAEAVFVEVD